MPSSGSSRLPPARPARCRPLRPASRPGAQPSAPAVTAAISASGLWPSYHHDAARSGVSEPGPSLAAAGPAWRSPQLDGAVYAEPVVDGSIAIVATENDTVYGLDLVSGGVVWATHLGSPAPLSLIHALGAPCGNIDPLGITGTPVIDTARAEVFVAATLSGPGVVAHQLFGLDVRTGRVVMAGANLDPPGALPFAEQQRAALALGNGRVYVTYGGLAGDCGPYRGWVVSVTEAGIGQVSWAVPTPREGGIWATSGPAIDGAGNVWVAAGNGAQTNPAGPYDGSDSVTALTPALVPIGQFAPAGWAADNAADLDLGSTGPELLSGNQIFQIGKRGIGYLLQAGRFGFESEVASGSVCPSFGGQAYVAPIVYVSCADGVRAVRIRPGGTGFDVIWHGPATASGPPVVGGGLVWVVGTEHVLYGLNPATGGVVSRLPIGLTTHFTTPTVTGGKVIVATTTTVQAFSVPGWSGWQAQDGPPSGTSGAPAVASWGPGRLDLFVRGGDGHLWHAYRAPGGELSAWEDLGGQLTSAPVAVSWGTDRVDVFARGTDHAMWHKWWSAGGWSGWEDLGGQLSSAPAAASWAAGRLDVVAVGTDGAVWHKWWAGSGWLGWEPLGGQCTGDPGLASWGPGAVDVFCLGAATPSALWHRWFRFNQWSGWLQEVGGTWADGVAATSWALGRLDVFGVDGATGAPTHAWWDGSGWRRERLAGGLAATPAATSWGLGRIDVFGLGTDGLLYHTDWS